MCVCVLNLCKLLSVKFVCCLWVCVLLRRRREEAEEKARDTESKTRTPHKDVGKNQTCVDGWLIWLTP